MTESSADYSFNNIIGSGYLKDGTNKRRYLTVCEPPSGQRQEIWLPITKFMSPETKLPFHFRDVIIVTSSEKIIMTFADIRKTANTAWRNLYMKLRFQKNRNASVTFDDEEFGEFQDESMTKNSNLIKVESQFVCDDDLPVMTRQDHKDINRDNDHVNDDLPVLMRYDENPITDNNNNKLPVLVDESEVARIEIMLPCPLETIPLVMDVDENQYDGDNYTDMQRDLGKILFDQLNLSNPKSIDVDVDSMCTWLDYNYCDNFGIEGYQEKVNTLEMMTQLLKIYPQAQPQEPLPKPSQNVNNLTVAVCVASTPISSRTLTFRHPGDAFCSNPNLARHFECFSKFYDSLESIVDCNLMKKNNPMIHNTQKNGMSKIMIIYGRRLSSALKQLLSHVRPRQNGRLINEVLKVIVSVEEINQIQRTPNPIRNVQNYLRIRGTAWFNGDFFFIMQPNIKPAPPLDFNIFAMQVLYAMESFPLCVREYIDDNADISQEKKIVTNFSDETQWCYDVMLQY